ncbi:1036_t:CDS:1, partial [Entrophospora sp. SA101]
TNVDIPAISDPDSLCKRFVKIKDVNQITAYRIYWINFREEAHRVSDEDMKFIKSASTISFGESDQTVKERYYNLANQIRAKMEYFEN